MSAAGVENLGAVSAVVAALKADAGVQAAVSGRVYAGAVPPKAVFPLVVVTMVSDLPGAGDIAADAPGDYIHEILLDVKAVQSPGTEFSALQPVVARINRVMLAFEGSNAAGDTLVHDVAWEAGIQYAVVNDDATQERHLGSTFRLLVQDAD